MNKKILAVLTMSFFVTPVLAYRPFITEDACIAGKGVFQAETSYDYFMSRNGDTDKIFLFVAAIKI
jgi:hypothetical protein